MVLVESALSQSTLCANITESWPLEGKSLDVLGLLRCGSRSLRVTSVFDFVLQYECSCLPLWFSMCCPHLLDVVLALLDELVMVHSLPDLPLPHGLAPSATMV